MNGFSGLCCPKFFFVADSNEKMAVIEHDSERFNVRIPKDDLLIMTNHIIGNELRKDDQILIKYPRHNTILRYDKLDKKITESRTNFEFDDVSRIMCDRKSHVCQNKYGIMTIWSLYLDMKNKEYKIVYDLFGDVKMIKIDF